MYNASPWLPTAQEKVQLSALALSPPRSSPSLSKLFLLHFLFSFSTLLMQVFFFPACNRIFHFSLLFLGIVFQYGMCFCSHLSDDIPIVFLGPSKVSSPPGSLPGHLIGSHSLLSVPRVLSSYFSLFCNCLTLYLDCELHEGRHPSVPPMCPRHPARGLHIVGPLAAFNSIASGSNGN